MNDNSRIYMFHYGTDYDTGPLFFDETFCSKEEADTVGWMKVIQEIQGKMNWGLGEFEHYEWRVSAYDYEPNTKYLEAKLVAPQGTGEWFVAAEIHMQELGLRFLKYDQGCRKVSKMWVDKLTRKTESD